MSRASFFSSIFLCNHIGNHPEDEFTKFGYMSQREIEIFKNPTIFFVTCCKLLPTYGHINNVFLEIYHLWQKKEFKKSCV
jgi:hypothetical protein